MTGRNHRIVLTAAVIFVATYAGFQALAQDTRGNEQASSPSPPVCINADDTQFCLASREAGGRICFLKTAQERLICATEAEQRALRAELERRAELARQKLKIQQTR